MPSLSSCCFALFAAAIICMSLLQKHGHFCGRKKHNCTNEICSETFRKSPKISEEDKSEIATSHPVCLLLFRKLKHIDWSTFLKYLNFRKSPKRPEKLRKPPKISEKARKFPKISENARKCQTKCDRQKLAKLPPSAAHDRDQDQNIRDRSKNRSTFSPPPRITAGAFMSQTKFAFMPCM